MKRFLPKTLFGRALLILVLPTILVQVVSAYVFYERHWDNVTKHMANALAGEIAYLAYEADSADSKKHESVTWLFERTTGIYSKFEPGAKLVPHKENSSYGIRVFARTLRSRMDMPFSVLRHEKKGQIEVRVQVREGVIAFRTTLKRLESGTTSIFILWMTGAALVFSFIAILFLRNQVRPIRELAEAAESFGKGQDIIDLKPHGAQEVRRAARAFLVMRERIVRQIRTRTEMLAGISHDLRTPLTRMKLQLAMLGDSEEIKELQADVTQMEHMIDEYLAFAEGESGEESVRLPVSLLLEEIVQNYKRSGKEVSLSVGQDAEIEVRKNAFIRMMHNLIDNALHYGGNQCAISTWRGKGKLEIYLDDKGNGISIEERDQVFRPFTRLDQARNLNQGGVGLGLTIAQDTARSHGGNINLADAPEGGLRVTVRLPL